MRGLDDDEYPTTPPTPPFQDVPQIKSGLPMIAFSFGVVAAVFAVLIAIQYWH